ncbi:MAG: molybdenum cofactor guanylyltransferase [Desulfatiglandales bacterium]
MEVIGRNHLVGVILAGGKSTRFGNNKALQMVDTKPLIEKVYERLKGIFEEILVVTNRPESYSFLDCEIIKDRIEGVGPLGGIYTGLKHIYPSPGFFLPCDMPMLKEEVILYMCGLYNNGVDILVPKVGPTYFEPLHAIYSPRCVTKIDDLLEQKIFKIYYLFQKTKVKYIDASEIRRLDPKLSCFTNINTKEDFEKFICECNENFRKSEP